MALAFGVSFLLNHVSQFVRKKPPSLRRSRRVLTLAEKDITAHRKGLRMDRFCKRPGLSIRMQPHLAEIMPEPRLEECTFRFRERLT